MSKLDSGEWAVTPLGKYEYTREPIEVCEVIPSTVTLTREEFHAAFDRAFNSQSGDSWRLDLEKEIFEPSIKQG